MSIKVVCVTKVDGEIQQRVILEKATSPANLIAVADRFLPLAREHGIANGAHFERLDCYIDERQVQIRLLIEQVSTAFFLVRQRLYSGAGFVIFKHESDVKNFIAMVHSNAQPTYLAPPVWTGKCRQPVKDVQPEKQSNAGETAEYKDIIHAIQKQSHAPAEEAPKQHAEDPSKPSRQRRRMTAANLGLAPAPETN